MWWDTIFELHYCVVSLCQILFFVNFINFCFFLYVNLIILIFIKTIVTDIQYYMF
jgi:hypothetical protein